MKEKLVSIQQLIDRWDQLVLVNTGASQAAKAILAILTKDDSKDNTNPPPQEANPAKAEPS